MVNAITTHDSTLQEKIFIIKGEESYARTTDCILEEILHNGERLPDWDTHIGYMLIEMKIDVLRDIGASYVTLYDNDTVLGVYDFDTNTHSIELKYVDSEHDDRLKLNYEVEHNIYARYMGNKKCLKSTSKSYSFFEATPPAFESTLEFVEPRTYYPIDKPAEYTLKLSGVVGYDNQDIEIYDGTVLIDTITTDENGEATVSITDLTEGKHTIRARFVGTEQLSANSVSLDVSIGLDITITGIPSSYVTGQDIPVLINLKDYNGVKIGNTSLYVEDNGISSYGSAITDDEGNATCYLSYSDLRDMTITEGSFYGAKFKVKAGDLYGYSSLSDYYYVSVNSEFEITLTDPSTFVTYGNQMRIDGVVNTDEAIDINITGYDERTHTSFDLGTVTSNNGAFSFNYQGANRGNTIITASYWGVNDTCNVMDIYQYWKAPSTIINRTYDFFPPDLLSLTDMTNGFAFKVSDPRNEKILFNYVNGDTISFKVGSFVSYILVGTAFQSSQNIGVNVGDIVTIKRIDGLTLSVAINGILKGEFTFNDTNYFGFSGFGTPKVMLFDEFKQYWSVE